MKKLIYVSIIGLAVGTGFIGCKKEIYPKKNTDTLSTNSSLAKIEMASLYRVENGMIVISSVEDFDSIINIVDSKFCQDLINLNYTSYKETIKDDSLNTIEDEFLSALLNKDQSVQVGNYIYRINKATEKVYVIHKSHIESYQDLVSENISNKNVLEFSTEENVFELLNEYRESDSEKALSKNCQSTDQNNNGGWTQYADFIDVNNIYGNGKDKRYKFSVWIRVRYDNWGIYRKLFTEFKHKEAWGGTYDETYVSIAYQVQYLVKNGTSGLVTHYPSYPPSTSTGTSGYEYQTQNKEIIHYRQTKCLRAYDLRSWCWFRDRELLVPTLYPYGGCVRINAGGLNSFPC